MRQSLVCLVIMVFLCGCGRKEKFVSHYDDGQIKTSGYHDRHGQKVGEWLTYHENGQVKWQETYRRGKLEGTAISYNKDGQTVDEVVYQEGIGKQLLRYENGQVRINGNWKDGKLHGDWISYYDNGQVKNQGQWKYGKMDGDWVLYRQNGLLEMKLSYVEGGVNGVVTMYGDNGKPNVLAYYDNGRLLHTESVPR